MKTSLADFRLKEKNPYILYWQKQLHFLKSFTFCSSDVKNVPFVFLTFPFPPMWIYGAVL